MAADPRRDVEMELDPVEPGEVWGPRWTQNGPHTHRLFVFVPDGGSRVLARVQRVVYRAVTGDDRRKVLRH